MTFALGGIAYNLATLQAIMRKGTILPVCRVGEDIRNMIRESFGSCSVLDVSGFQFTHSPNVVNRLVYRHDGARDEWNSRRSSPLSLKNIPIEADAVMFNFISGNDVKLRDLKAFRQRYRGLIYFDFHSLALGHDSAGRRCYRYHPRWRDYVSVADIVQMNRLELASIMRAEQRSKVDVYDACRGLHETGPGIAIITDGKNGIIISTRSPARGYHVPATAVRRVIDTTGCGDSLGAAFVWKYLITNDVLKSIEFASRIASSKATFSGIDGFGRINEIAKRLGSPRKAIRL